MISIQALWHAFSSDKIGFGQSKWYRNTARHCILHGCLSTGVSIAKLNYLNNKWASIFVHPFFYSFRNFPNTFQRYSINIIMMSWITVYFQLRNVIDYYDRSTLTFFVLPFEGIIIEITSIAYVTVILMLVILRSNWTHVDRSWRPRRGDFDSIQGFLLTHDENRIRKFLSFRW